MKHKPKYGADSIDPVLGILADNNDIGDDEGEEEEAEADDGVDIGGARCEKNDVDAAASSLMGSSRNTHAIVQACPSSFAFTITFLLSCQAQPSLYVGLFSR